MDHRPKVLLGVCGGIAAYKAIEVVRRLRDRGCEVRCALSRGAASFVTPLTLEVLSGFPVYEQEYLGATGRGEESHIVAAQWADVFCVVPATAHFLARLALGLADDFMTTTALAYQGRVVVAPAMHAEMWSKEPVQNHVAALERRGVIFVGPEQGPLASGEWGMGRLAAPTDVVDAVLGQLEGTAGAAGTGAARAGELAGKTVLISAGPTHEPIDPVRFLGNRSSGKMGFALAAEATERGARTLLVSGPVILETPPGVERHKVKTGLEMQAAINAQAPQADLIIMTAAVSDFRPTVVADSKIKKHRGVPHIELAANPDILSGLTEIAPDALRVGFAAETEPSESEAYAKLARKNADFLVWNNVAAEGIGFGSDDNEVTIYRPAGEPIFVSRRPKRDLAAFLLNLFGQALEDRVRE